MDMLYFFFISKSYSGAHVCGFVGKILQNLNKKLDRISALDPAGKIQLKFIFNKVNLITNMLFFYRIWFYSN